MFLAKHRIAAGFYSCTYGVPSIRDTETPFGFYRYARGGQPNLSISWLDNPTTEIKLCLECNTAADISEHACKARGANLYRPSQASFRSPKKTELFARSAIEATIE